MVASNFCLSQSCRLYKFVPPAHFHLRFILRLEKGCIKILTSRFRISPYFKTIWNGISVTSFQKRPLKVNELFETFRVAHWEQNSCKVLNYFKTSRFKFVIVKILNIRIRKGELKITQNLKKRLTLKNAKNKFLLFIAVDGKCRLSNTSFLSLRFWVSNCTTTVPTEPESLP